MPCRQAMARTSNPSEKTKYNTNDGQPPRAALAESKCLYSATQIQVYGSGKSSGPGSQWAATLRVSVIIGSHRQPNKITLGTKRSSPGAFASVLSVENRSGRPTKRSIWRQETTHNSFLVLHPGRLTAHSIHSGFQTSR